MYNKRSAVQWCGWRVIITRMTETKVYCHWDDVNERVSLLLLGEISLLWKHTSVVFITFYSACVSKKIWCLWGGGVGDAICNAEEKIIGFTCSTKLSVAIIFSPNFHSWQNILYYHLLSVFHTYLKRYPATESENQNLSSKTTCLTFNVTSVSSSA